MKEQLHLPQSFTCATECCRWQSDSYLQFCLLSDYCWELTAMDWDLTCWQVIIANGNVTLELNIFCVFFIAFIFREFERVVSVLSEFTLWGSLSEKTFIYWYFSHIELEMKCLMIQYTGFPHLLTNKFVIAGQGSFRIIVLYILALIKSISPH